MNFLIASNKIYSFRRNKRRKTNYVKIKQIIICGEKMKREHTNDVVKGRAGRDLGF